MKKIPGLTLITALCLLMSVSAYADEPISDEVISDEIPSEEAISDESIDKQQASDAIPYDFAAVTVDGKEQLFPSSAASDYVFDMSYIFDCNASTAVQFNFENDETKTVNIYAAFTERTIADTFAAMIGGETGTVIYINVYGTNDSLLEDWRQLTVLNPAEEKDGFKVFDLKDFARKYSYYRFEFMLENGEYFTLSELALFGDEIGVPAMKYVSDGEVEAGETPALVPAQSEENKKVEFGLFHPLGFRK